MTDEQELAKWQLARCYLDNLIDVLTELGGSEPYEKPLNKLKHQINLTGSLLHTKIESSKKDKTK
jgi:hypothetical protein